MNSAVPYSAPNSSLRHQEFAHSWPKRLSGQNSVKPREIPSAPTRLPYIRDTLEWILSRIPRRFVRADRSCVNSTGQITY